MTEDGQLRDLALSHAVILGLPPAKVLEAAEAYYIFLTKRVASKEEDAE